MTRPDGPPPMTATFMMGQMAMFADLSKLKKLAISLLQVYIPEGKATCVWNVISP